MTAFDLPAARSVIALHKPTADAIGEWLEADTNPEPVCRKCDDGFHVPYDLEPTPLCNGCAHQVAEWLPSMLTGWAAALDEAERLRSERAADIEMWRATEADLATNHRRADAAGRSLADVTDRVATIASEAFGPFQVQGVEADPTAIEQGLSAQRRALESLHGAMGALAGEVERVTALVAGLSAARDVEVDRLRALADAADRAMQVTEDQASQVARLLRAFALAVPRDAIERGDLLMGAVVPELARPGDVDDLTVGQAVERLLALVPDPARGQVGQ